MARVNDRLKSLAVRSFARRTSQSARPRNAEGARGFALLPPAHLASHPDKSHDSNQEVAL